MPQRVRVAAPPPQPLDTESWILEVHRAPGDPGGVYEFIRPEAAGEIIAEHAERQLRELPEPTPHEVSAMGRTLSSRFWRLTRSRVNLDEFVQRALS